MKVNLIIDRFLTFFLNFTAPPSFEDSQKNPVVFNSKANEAGEASPSAPLEPTAPPPQE